MNINNVSAIWNSKTSCRNLRAVCSDTFAVFLLSVFLVFGIFDFRFSDQVLANNENNSLKPRRVSW
jgi:hypothetical protein